MKKENEVEYATECTNSDCGWKGHDSECVLKHFGGYCGIEKEPWGNWGWEEWDDLVCPKCGNASLEFNHPEEEI